jgi:hypothetical protein
METYDLAYDENGEYIASYGEMVPVIQNKDNPEYSAE